MTEPTLYTWGTPNGLKPVLMLEELGVPYQLVPVPLGQNAQKSPDFLAKNLNGRIPVLEVDVDGERVAIAESAAILMHLAETHDDRFLPARGAVRARALQWSMFQMGGVGPMFGQLGYWRRRDTPNEEALERYRVETERLYGVLDQRLGEARYLAGDEYTTADMLTLFWARGFDYFGLKRESWPHVARWLTELEARPAVQRTLAVPFG